MPISKLKSSRSAFTFLEILTSAAILAVCFVPILSSSQQTVVETEDSQENLMARHFMVDLVERYRGATIEELSALPHPGATPAALGSEPSYISADPLLNDAQAIYQEMLNAAVVNHSVDPGQAGVKEFINIQSIIKITREAFCVENPTPLLDGGAAIPNAAHLFTVTCSVRWQPRKLKGERSVSLAVVVVQ